MSQEKEKRDIKITVRLSESEHEQLKRKASGQVAVWLRELALDQQDKKPQKMPVADPELVRHMARIGNNINQIAKVLNTDTSKIESLALLSQLGIVADEMVALRKYYIGIE